MRAYIVINFKAYPTSYGVKALEIAEAAEEVTKKYEDVRIILAVPATELRPLASTFKVDIFAQHADPVPLGARTGHIPPEIIADTGAKGFLINHSEKRLRLDQINYLVRKSKELGLETIVCADTPETSAAAAALKPDAIAVEPPELIGTGIAVSKAKPEIITGTVEAVRRINKDVVILTGAGISNPEDVEAAIRLGTAGVLVASAVMKAEDPKAKIEGMAQAAVKVLKAS